VFLYRCRLGFLLGHRFLLLVHRGRRTARRYETVLEVVHRDRDTGELIVVSGFGPRASWFRNVTAGNAVEIRVGRTCFVPAYRLLDPDEAAATLADYERRNRVVAPVVRLVLARLGGFAYDSSPAAHDRLVRTLPLVAFRPAPGPLSAAPESAGRDSTA
jgi:deazaflavin-dependent oxidoreductase (nitroreductase family)